MSSLQTAVIAAFVLALSFLMTGVARKLGLRFHVIDRPNDRSSHIVAKPRIGGLGIVISFYVGLFLIFDLVPEMKPQINQRLIGLAIGAGIVAIVGLGDDIYSASTMYRYGVSAAIKYGAQMLAALVALSYGNRINILSLAGWGMESPWMETLITVLWITWMANAYNFMDGIDGLAAGTGVIYALFSALIASLTGQTTISIVCVVLLMSCLGFLRHNFPRPRVFMGDVGAIFLGYVFGTLTVMLCADQPRPTSLIPLLIIYATFNYDAIYTLLRRVWREKTVFGPHRTHLYQRLIVQGLSHRRVTLIYYFISIMLGALALWYLQTSASARNVILVIVFLILMAGTLSVASYEHQSKSN